MLEFTGIFQQQDVVAGGSGPVVADMTRISYLSNVTSHNATMPVGVSAGDLLLAFVANDGSATVSATGFTAVFSTANTTQVRLSVLAKVAVGTESGTTVDFVTSATETGGVMVYLITGWGGTIATHIVSGTAVLGNTVTSLDPPSLTSGFGAVPTLWFATCATSGVPSPNGYSANYEKHATLAYTAGAVGGTTAGQVSSVWRELTAASEDPGAFTFPSTTVGLANTVAVKGT